MTSLASQKQYIGYYEKLKTAQHPQNCMYAWHQSKALGAVVQSKICVFYSVHRKHNESKLISNSSELIDTYSRVS